MGSVSKGNMWSLRRFRREASRLLDEIPSPLLEGLNGGVIVVPGVRRCPDDPPGVYLLGEYRVDPGLGCMIVLYYGSFRRVLGDAPWAQVVEELRRTIRHELRHHAEHRAGLAELEIEDEWQRRRWREHLHGDQGGAVDRRERPGARLARGGSGRGRARGGGGQAGGSPHSS